MRTRTTVVPAIKNAARVALAIASIGSLAACASIPQRAWRNGEAMTQSRAYQSVMSGNMSFQAHRQLQQSLDPLRLNYREVAFPPFGQWW